MINQKFVTALSTIRPILLRKPDTIFNIKRHRKTFSEPDRRGGYTKRLTVEEKVELWKNSVNLDYREEFKKLFNIILTPKYPVEDIQHGDYKFIINFRELEDLSHWIVTTDADHGEGKSTAELVKDPVLSNAVFRGNICTEVIQTGKQTQAGYVGFRTPYNSALGYTFPYDWRPFTHLVIRYRGDGRRYLLNIGMKRFFDIHWLDVFTWCLFTRGGPYWQTAKIPFSKFYLTHRACVQDNQDPIDLHNVKQMTVSLIENYDGPFQLEIAYIALYYDKYHLETFNYEKYEVSSVGKVYST